MSTIAKLLVGLALSSEEFMAGLDKAEKKTNTSVGNITSGLSKIGSGLVLGIGAAAAAATTATGVFLASTIGGASDLNETISKVGVVFGSSAKSIMDFAANSATAMGMSQGDALKAAGVYGNLFRAMGMAEDASANMSTGLVGLAADLASFNNLDPTDVMDKLRSGLSGQTEPLRSLGVNINAAMLEAKAMEMGLLSVGGEFTAAAKAQATYALITEQTTLAQGDFSRTSGGLANQQRILAATFQNVKDKIGTALLPLITKMTETINKIASDPAFQKMLEDVIKTLGDLANQIMLSIPTALDWFGKLSAWFKDNQPIVIGILAALGVAILAFGIQAAIGFGIAMAPLLPAIAVMVLIGAYVALLAYAWKTNFGGIRDTMLQAWGKIKPVLVTLKNWFAEHIPAALEKIKPIFEAVRAWLGEHIPAALAKSKAFWDDVLLPAIVRVWNFISVHIFPLLAALANLVIAGLGAAIKVLSAIWEKYLLPVITKIWEWIDKNLNPVFEKLHSWIASHVGPAFRELGNKIHQVSEFIRKLTEKIKEMKLPAWLTPGSPTPFENALVGIGKAMNDVTSNKLPSFDAKLNLLPSPLDSMTLGAGEKKSPYNGPSAKEIGRAVAQSLLALGVTQ